MCWESSVLAVSAEMYLERPCKGRIYKASNYLKWIYMKWVAGQHCSKVSLRITVWYSATWTCFIFPLDTYPAHGTPTPPTPSPTHIQYTHWHNSPECMSIYIYTDLGQMTDRVLVTQIQYWLHTVSAQCFKTRNTPLDYITTLLTYALWAMLSGCIFVAFLAAIQ